MSAALALSAMLLSQPALAEDGFFTREQVIRHTPAWTGERFPDGRPKVPDDILERMREVTLEEAWATLRREIGRASCRERAEKYGEVPVVAVSLKKKRNDTRKN